jgi:glutamate synthase domain-containing protein 3
MVEVNKGKPKAPVRKAAPQAPAARKASPGGVKAQAGEAASGTLGWEGKKRHSFLGQRGSEKSNLHGAGLTEGAIPPKGTPKDANYFSGGAPASAKLPKTEREAKAPTAIDAEGKSTREINSLIREAIAEGSDYIRVLNPGSQHSLGVAILKPVTMVFEGSVGYFGVGLIDHPLIQIKGRAGWSLAENMMSGTVVVEKVAGSSCGSCIRGGRLVVKGSVGGRTGISMKGGEIVVGGDAGFLTGFMMQNGKIVIFGNSGRGTGDSMYDGTIYVAGEIGSLGVDAELRPLDAEDRKYLDSLAREYGLKPKGSWKKIRCAGKLYNYDLLEPLERKLML